MAGCYPVGTPMDVHTKYSKNMNDEAIGHLLFAAYVTRPDISFSVIQLSRYADEPKWAHWMAVKRIMRYLSGTINMKLTYSKFQTEILGYCDSEREI